MNSILKGNSEKNFDKLFFLSNIFFKKKFNYALMLKFDFNFILRYIIGKIGGKNDYS